MILKIVHIGLASLIFFSSMGITVHKHFCHNELKTVQLYGKAKSCKEVKKKERFPKLCCIGKIATHSTETCPLNTENEPCKHCEDVVEFLVLDDIIELPNYLFQVNEFKVYTPILVLEFARLQLNYPTPIYQNYKPPLPFKQDFSILYQTFLC